jgi:transposase
MPRSEATPAATSGSPRPGQEALRQVRDSARALLAQGKVEETWDMLLAALEAVLVKNRELELLVAKLRRERLGTTSERMDPGQLALLFDAMLDQAGPPAPVDPAAEAREDAQLDAEIQGAEQASGQSAGKVRKKGPGWTTRGVERRVHRVEVPESERACRDCGKPMKRIGDDVTRRLEYVPAHFVEHEHHLDKYACGSCKEGVMTAPAPAQVLERSAADASLLAHVVVSKFADHVPLHRLSRIYARSGAEIPVSTLCDWMAGVGELIAPLVGRLEERVLGAYIVRTDATGLKVLDPQSSDNIERGSIWAYVGDDKDVLFRYTKTGEGATGPWKLLAGRMGYIQADAASVHDRLFDGQAASAIELGCWAHGRRRLVALQETDCRVAYPLKLIARLYRIEHLADARQLEPEERARLRKERSTAVLDKLHRWLLATRASEPPSTDLAKAAGYILNHWTALTRFVEDGRVSLDNNLCEQQLRDVALGRKNYLFAGSHEAAERTAALYSLTRTCAQHGVPPLPYLTDVLGKLASGWDARRLDELLPHRWRDPGDVSATARAL